MAVQSLIIIFLNQEGSKTSVTVPGVRDDIIAVEVTAIEVR